MSSGNSEGNSQTQQTELAREKGFYWGRGNTHRPSTQKNNSAKPRKTWEAKGRSFLEGWGFYGSLWWSFCPNLGLISLNKERKLILLVHKFDLKIFWSGLEFIGPVYCQGLLEAVAKAHQMWVEAVQWRIMKNGSSLRLLCGEWVTASAPYQRLTCSPDGLLHLIHTKSKLT